MDSTHYCFRFLAVIGLLLTCNCFRDIVHENDSLNFRRYEKIKYNLQAAYGRCLRQHDGAITFSGISDVVAFDGIHRTLSI